MSSFPVLPCAELAVHLAPSSTSSPLTGTRCPVVARSRAPLEKSAAALAGRGPVGAHTPSKPRNGAMRHCALRQPSTRGLKPHPAMLDPRLPCFREPRGGSSPLIRTTFSGRCLADASASSPGSLSAGSPRVNIATRERRGHRGASFGARTTCFAAAYSRRAAADGARPSSDRPGAGLALPRSWRDRLNGSLAGGGGRSPPLPRRLDLLHDRRIKALKINDDIVQRLAMAKLALDLNRPDESAAHLEEALVASRQIISDLTSAHTGERGLGPGDLRTEPSEK
jgi:hypothetical protein